MAAAAGTGRTHSRQAGQWVLLAYRLPREPSRPRLSVWRTLERIGAARLGDGLVALPADARTREQFDWLAEEITEAGGVAGIWLSYPATLAQEEAIAAEMRAARAAEYEAVTNEATAAMWVGRPERARALRRLREQLRRINRRDFFPPPQRDSARAAVQALAELNQQQSQPGPPDQLGHHRGDTLRAGAQVRDGGDR